MNTNDTNRQKAHAMIDHIFKGLLPAQGMAERSEQIKLSHRMLDTMLNGGIALCDAGTGIGKTYAYLVAAAAANRSDTEALRKPVIISTSSIALQNAVQTEYLPLLSCILLADGQIDRPLLSVIRKGKGHYVCDERLQRRLRQVNFQKKDPAAADALRTLKGTLDMDNVPHLSGYDRERVCVPQFCDCDHQDCRYKRFLKRCDADRYVFQICNHNLLLADAIHRSQGKRPIFPEHSVIIVDEAHKLPEKEIAPHALQPEHLRVAAYCRVSSDSEDQLHSYAAQIRNYTEVIAQHDGWDLVDVYADEGLTGTRVDKRDDFNRMMRDCRKGKIDCILVKSVARFARNTKECLASLRELSGMGVTVRFEKENIDTGTLTTELMVSVSGSLAQQESLSISANQRLSYQHRMECGEFITCSAPYGYRIKDKKNLEILPEEAAAVRWAFDAYLKGNSSKWIAEQLTAKGVPTQNGAEKWQETSIRYLLTNEKYIGDTLCQKSYSCGFPFVQKRNRGERMQYYVENSHPAIIDRDTFEKVQELLRKKAQKEKRRRERSPFALKILCGNCGTMFLRRTSKNGYVTWVCRTHDRSADACHVGRIPESEIRAAFLRMYRKLKCNADMILKPAMEQMNALDAILQQNNPKTLTINRAIAEATEESHKISTLRVNGLLDADTCTARMNVISAKLAQLRRERRRLAENEALDEVMDALRKVRQTILDGPEQMDDFDDDLFESLVEKIIAESQTEIRFRLYGGLELRERLEVAVR